MAAPATALTVVDRVDQSPAIALLEARVDRFLPFLPGATDDDKRQAFDRMRQGVAVAMVKNPDLLGCTPESLFLASLEAVSQGLQPTGAAGGAHLVPYRSGQDKIAQLIPDYRGVIRLITGPGSDVVAIERDVVKEGDAFDYSRGSDGFLEHKPSLDADRSARATTHAYAIFHLRSGGQIVDVMDRTAIERIRSRSRSGAQGPWATDWDEMAIKTVIKHGAKVVPVRPEVRALLVREDELAGDDDADPTVAEPVTGPTKASRLASRLKNVTPPEKTPAEVAAAMTEQQKAFVRGETDDPGEPPTTQPADPRRAWLDEHHVSADYALETARRLFPEVRGRLTDEQWAEVTEALLAEADEPSL